MTGPEKEAYAVLSPFLGPELSADIIAHRKGLKCPLTARGARSLIREYQATGHMIEAAEYHLNMGWRGFEASWFKRAAPAAQQPRKTAYQQHQDECRAEFDRVIFGDHNEQPDNVVELGTADFRRSRANGGGWQ